MYAPIDVIFDSDEVGSVQVGGTKDKPTYVLLPAIEDCIGVAVTYANVPFTYFVIDDTCNVLSLNGNSVTIIPGTYNSVNISTQLKSLFSAYISDIEIFIDSTTSKMVIYSLTATVFTVLFGSEQLAKIFGFNNLSNTSTTATFLNDSDTAVVGKHNVQGNKVANLTGPSQMFLDSDLGSGIFGSVRNQTGNRGLLGFWPINSNYQGTIEYINPNPEMIPMTKTKISRLNLSLTIGNRTSYGTAGSPGTNTNYLQLNGEPFQVGLRFWKKVEEGVEVNDQLGNRSYQVHSTPRLYNPKKLKRNNVS